MLVFMPPGKNPAERSPSPGREPFQHIVHGLEDALRAPLPGPRAHERMRPRPRPVFPPSDETVRPAAALLLLYPRGEVPYLLLTVRSRDLPSHRGQLSLPGGVVEPGEALNQAALREAREEVGLDTAKVRLLGALSPVYIPVSGFLLHPFVGVSPFTPEVRPNPAEVERILMIPLSHLIGRERLRSEIRILQDRQVRIPYFDLEGEKLWGATAMVLAELLWILGSPPPAPGED